MPRLQKAVFLTTVANPRDSPRALRARGRLCRSFQCRKSSAINTLAGRVRLAYVSKTPGVPSTASFHVEEGKYFVDLPGYGFAKAPEAIRSQWRPATVLT